MQAGPGSDCGSDNDAPTVSASISAADRDVDESDRLRPWSEGADDHRGGRCEASPRELRERRHQKQSPLRIFTLSGTNLAAWP